jgi:hypothetical protein
VGLAEGVDPVHGSLLLRSGTSGDIVRVESGEVIRCRIVELPRVRGRAEDASAAREPGTRTG